MKFHKKYPVLCANIFLSTVSSAIIAGIAWIGGIDFNSRGPLQAITAGLCVFAVFFWINITTDKDER